MAAPVHRIGDPNTGGGVVTSSTQGSVYANNILIATDGSPVSGHGIGIHAGPNTANGSSDVIAENIPVNSQGDADTCGHTRAAGSPDVFVN